MGVENYHVIELVGEGSFGKVYKGRRKYTGQTVALKFILKHGKTEKDIQNLRQEIEILRKLKLENIIQMLDSFESPHEFCVVTEFAKALLKLVADYSTVALNPSRKDAINESPLKVALFSLAKMCAHTPCRHFLRSSDLYHVIGRPRQSPEATIANYASVVFNKTSDA